MEEMAHKESKQAQGKAKTVKGITGLESEDDQASDKSDDFDIDDEEEEGVQWNRAVAETIYNETRVNLEAMYNNIAMRTDEYESVS